MKSSDPFFSIILTSYNREDLILDCIQSVLNQSFVDFELIVIDDCSVDSTVDLLQTIGDNRIKIHRNEVNKERCYSRNKGVGLATGKFILFLDSDDQLECNHLKNWFDYLNQRGFFNGFFFCLKQIVSNDGVEVPRYNNFDVKNLYRFLFETPVIPGQICVSRDIIQKYRFKDEYLIFEDTALWLEIVREFKIKMVNFSSYIYYIHDSNTNNIQTSNFGIPRLKAMKTFFKSNTDIKKMIGSQNIRKEYSSTLFNVCKYHLYNNNRKKATIYLLKSILQYFTIYQLNHRFFVLFNLLLNKPIKEYGFK